MRKMATRFQGENLKASKAQAPNNKVADDERLRKEKTTKDKLKDDNDKNIG